MLTSKGTPTISQELTIAKMIENGARIKRVRVHRDLGEAYVAWCRERTSYPVHLWTIDETGKVTEKIC